MSLLRKKRIYRTVTWVVVSLCAPLACAPLPSREPLGVGALPPGGKLSSDLRKEARARKLARPGSAARGEDFSASSAKESAPEPKPDPAPPEPRGADAGAKAGTLAAAGAAKTEGAPIADPSGDYRGDDVSSYRLSGLPDKTDKDPNARVNVRKTGDKKLDFALVDSSNGKDICTLAGTLEGRTATITVGQSCFEQDTAAASATATVTRGTATFENTRLVLDLTLDFELLLGDDEHAGTLEYHFDGARR
jgi:hypothetical protein